MAGFLKDAQSSVIIAFLKVSNCDAAQGLYFSRPVEPDELAKLLQRQPGTTPAC